MAVRAQYRSDVDAILAKRHDNGADLWATPQGSLVKGSPFTTLDCAMMLTDLRRCPREADERDPEHLDPVGAGLRYGRRAQVGPSAPAG